MTVCLRLFLNANENENQSQIIFISIAFELKMGQYSHFMGDFIQEGF